MDFWLKDRLPPHHTTTLLVTYISAVCCVCDTHFVKVGLCHSGVGIQLVVEPRMDHGFAHVVVEEQRVQNHL